MSIHNIQKKDYVVVQTAKEGGGVNKPQLIRVKHVGDGRVVGILQKDPHLLQVSVEAKVTEVLANLGSRPAPGKVYGYDLSKLYVKTMEHEWAGELHFFSRPDEENGEKLWKNLNNIPRIFKKKGFDHLAEACSYIWEVHPQQGKYAGFYLHSKDSTKKPHRIVVSADKSTMEKASVASYTYVLVHELCHAIDFQILDKFPKLKAEWIDLFHTSIAARYVKTERCAEILKKLLKSGNMKEVMSEADDEFKADLKLILKWLREFRNVSTREVQLMISGESQDGIKNVWPKASVRSKKLTPVVTDYACKNYRELFAEAATYYLLDRDLPNGEKLPKEISKLVEKSLLLADRNYKMAAEVEA